MQRSGAGRAWHMEGRKGVPRARGDSGVSLAPRRSSSVGTTQLSIPHRHSGKVMAITPQLTAPAEISVAVTGGRSTFAGSA